MRDPADATERLHRRVRRIVAVIIVYHIVEACVAIGAGAAASSTALVGFGLDSSIEAASALALAWQFTRRDPKRWERPTLRVIGTAFFAMAAYITADALSSLVRAAPVDRSPVGIAVTVASLIAMPVMAWFQSRAGRALGSRSVAAEAQQLMLSGYLSAAVLVGLLLNWAFAWSWSDSVAALVVAVLAVREGIVAWRGARPDPLADGQPT